MTISKELLNELLSGVERPEDLLGWISPWCRNSRFKMRLKRA